MWGGLTAEIDKLLQVTLIHASNNKSLWVKAPCKAEGIHEVQ